MVRLPPAPLAVRIYVAITSSEGWRSTEVEGYPYRLVSFFYLQRESRLLQRVLAYTGPLILDSGAFSVWNRGETIALRDYIAFCKWFGEHSHSAELEIVNLDVIPGRPGRVTVAERVEAPERGWENLLKMEEAGLHSIPVFHQGEPLEWLRRLVEHNPRIGISPDNSKSLASHLRWFRRLLGEGYLREGIRAGRVRPHGFAATGLQHLSVFPFYSADSSTYALWAGMGGVFGYRRRRDGGLDQEQVRYKDNEMLRRGRGPQYHDGVLGMAARLERVRANLRALRDLESYITGLWRARGVVWEERIEEEVEVTRG